MQQLDVMDPEDLGAGVWNLWIACGWLIRTLTIQAWLDSIGCYRFLTARSMESSLYLSSLMSLSMRPNAASICCH